jgi:copper(I)-binding protein
MRTPWSAALAGSVVAVLGAAGLVRGAVPQSVASGAAPSEPIVVSGAYVLPPVAPSKTAAAYFTVTNETSRADRLLSVVTGASDTAVLHVTVNGAMKSVTGGVVIPAHGKLVLSVGHGHVMIENVFGTLNPGDNVNMTLTFQNAGSLEVNAPVRSR